VPGLRQVFLSSGDRRIRNLAGQALARSASHAGLLYTGSWMTPSQLRAIAWVLGEIGDKTSSARLSHLLTHRDELMRARAAAALGKIADPATAPALHAALNDISPRVRASAATALGLLGVTDASQWLTPTLRDPHPAVRSAAEAALRRLPTDQD
jgi:HEAT repeat protein